MSPWDIIGWAIAIPFAMLALLFVGAFVVAVFRHNAKQAKVEKSENPSRHLKLVEDD